MSKQAELQRYEALMLTVPELTKDETVLIEKQIDEAVRKATGSVLSFEPWGKYRLEYPVNKNDYGVYLLARFEVPRGSEALKDLQTMFAIKLNLIVMRHMVHALESTASLAYQRPKSLEEAPEAGDGRGFSRGDHRKIEGLISAVDSSGRFNEATDDLEEDEDLE